jgi:exonuclease SbcC
MLFERLELVNFEGYRKAEIRFTEGLNIITGRNSTGKTAILEALIFALYGMVPGVEKRLLVSKLQGTTNKMSVKLSARIDDKKIEILREGRLVERKDKTREFRTERLSLKIDGKEKPVSGEEDLKREIIKLTGMGVKMFTNLIYAKQGELTNILEPKKEDMDLILGITLMEELEEQLESAKKYLEKYEGKDVGTMLEMLKPQLDQKKKQIDELTKQIKSISQEVKELKSIVEKAKSKEIKKLMEQIEKRDSLLKDIGEKEAAILNSLRERNVTSVEELKESLRELDKEIGELVTRLQEHEKEEKEIDSICQQLNSKLLKIDINLRNAGVTTIKELEEKKNSIQIKLNQLNKEYENAEAEFKRVECEKNKLEGKISALRDEIKAHEELLDKGYAECPTCGQKVDPEVVRQKINSKKHEIKDLSEKLRVVKSQYDHWKREHDLLKEEISQHNTNLDRLKGIYDSLIDLLGGATKEQLEQRLDEEEKRLEEIRQTINEWVAQRSQLEIKKQDFQKAIDNIERMKKEVDGLKEEYQKCLKEIECNLQILGFSFAPEDKELKVKIAGKLPLGPEELEEKEKELNEKNERLEDLRNNLNKLKEEEEGISKKINELQKRLDKAKVCDSLKEIIEAIIEEWRERMLRLIADEALRVYETLTDQRVYMAFRINKDDYTVEVLPAYLEGYIPAKRVGGGHQTLIALAVRIALLNVLNKRSLLILDEPTYGVDSENLPQLMSYFSEVAKKIKQTILVTHYGLGEEEAANIIKVKIAEDGSSIVTSK